MIKILSLILLVSALLSPPLDWEGRCYLATFPRSGNHWLRYLLEEVTHVATSSVYRDGDPPHQGKTFPWGGYCCPNGYEGMCRYAKNGERVVIKTHYPAYEARDFDKLPYQKTIRIIRNPVAAIYSFYEYTMRKNNQPIENNIPHPWLIEAIDAWKRFEEYWDKQPNVKTVRYEDLFNNSKEELKEILLYLDYAFNQQDIDRALEKHPPREGIRNHADHYREEDLDYLREELKDLMLQYGYS